MLCLVVIWFCNVRYIAGRVEQHGCTMLPLKGLLFCSTGYKVGRVKQHWRTAVLLRYIQVVVLYLLFVDSIVSNSTALNGWGVPYVYAVAR